MHRKIDLFHKNILRVIDWFMKCTFREFKMQNTFYSVKIAEAGQLIKKIELYKVVQSV